MFFDEYGRWRLPHGIPPGKVYEPGMRVSWKQSPAVLGTIMSYRETLTGVMVVRVKWDDSLAPPDGVETVLEQVGAFHYCSVVPFWCDEWCPT